MRDEMITAKENKRRYWIYTNHKNVEQRLTDRAKPVKMQTQTLQCDMANFPRLKTAINRLDAI